MKRIALSLCLSVTLSLSLVSCADLPPEERSALIRIGESTTTRVLDAKFGPPAQHAK